jgi:DtxR family Mn-dependent transcriptional regulator
LNYSTSEENYLKAIFHLQRGEGKVTTNDLAEKLNAKPASITDMMKKLNAKKLLNYKPYYGFSLSEEGKRIAISVIRRHRLWEFFLSEKLNFSWDEVHSIAEDLEHVRHKKLIDKLDEYLGFPRFDPHGDPIPDQKGRMKNVSGTMLAVLPEHQPAEVCQVTSQSTEILDYLLAKNISIGTRLEIKKRFPFDGSIEVKIRNQSLVMTQQLANNLLVKRISL